MTSIGTTAYNASQNLTATTTVEAPAEPQKLADAKIPESEKLGVTDEGKKLMSALKEVDDVGQEMIDGKNDKSVGDHIESFTYGALGIDHPNEAEKIEDDSYSAGQYLKGALTVGGLLLAII
jgi:hypothetical protein